LLLATLLGSHPLLKKLFADAAYQGPKFQNALTKILPDLRPKSSSVPIRSKDLAVLPKRWIVERTIAWLNRCRRLAKDWENLNRKALAFLRLASIRLKYGKAEREVCSAAISKVVEEGQREFEVSDWP